MANSDLDGGAERPLSVQSGDLRQDGPGGMRRVRTFPLSPRNADVQTPKLPYRRKISVSPLLRSDICA